jgi:hypothetical protein
MSNIFASEYGKTKIRETMLEKYGVINPSQYAEYKRKATNSARNSNLEIRITKLLDQYHIEYERHWFIRNDLGSHEYDFYLPKYKILLDADGVYFHAYLSDPDGRRVRDDYDDIRLQLIPENHIFQLIVEGHEDAGIKYLVDTIKAMESDVFDYKTELFTWCRSQGFPYPQYDQIRMDKDYKSLCRYNKLTTYNPNSRLGESIIRNFHKSIYSAHCGNFPSPLEGWNNDEILKKAILNRLIYINNVDPSKVLRGLYISKLAPRVSMFNPVLAKYITTKYLDEYSTVFDPFSGYSGRLLGVTAAGKRYIGQDLNKCAVSEANKIISTLKLSQATIIHKNTLYDNGSYECLFTCPPYNKKEIYADESEFKSCDEWITECLTRYKCDKYVFVVDSTENYKNNVVETLMITSHLNPVTEQIIVINKQ